MKKVRTFDQMQATFYKKVRQEDGHTPIIKETTGDPHYWNSAHDFTLKCSCGWKSTGHGRKVVQHYSGANGDVLTSEYRTFNKHISDVIDDLHISPTPILIAKLHKVRVTNEIWLFHKSHDQPNNRDPYYSWVWTVWEKNSNGWRQRGGAQNYQAGLSYAASTVEKREHLDDVEWMNKETIGVEAPVSTIITAASKLVADAKELKDTPDALRDHLKLVDEGVTQLNILKQLKTELEERLYNFMDLGL